MPFFHFWSRKKKRTPIDRVQSRHNADFDWHPAKQNPFTRETERSWQVRAKYGVLLGSCLIFFGLLIYHPFFHISRVEITGAQRISEENIRLATLGVLEHRTFFVIPGNSIFFARLDAVTSMISSRFSVSSLHLEKQFPNTLNITIEERLATILYDSGDEYVFVGLDGTVVEKIRKVRDDEWTTRLSVTTTTLPDGTVRREEKTERVSHTPSVVDLQTNVGDFPIILDSTTAPTSSSLEVHKKVLKPLFAERIVLWFELLKADGVHMTYGELLDAFGNLVVHTSERWSIKIDLTLDPTIQVQRLSEALKKEIPRPSIEYIDMRYGDRIHWK